MKKRILLGMLAIAGLFATSCQEQIVPVVNEGEAAIVSLQVETPEIATRAFSDGTTATVLQYAVYDAEGNIINDFTVTDAEIKMTATVELQLTTGNEYGVIFWAASESAPYTVDFAAKTMTVDYEGALSNNEDFDAFYKYEKFTVTGPMSKTIELKRPFAQLNVGTNDFAAAAATGYVPATSSVKVSNVYTTLDLFTGVATGETEVTFAANAIPEGETFPVAGYDYIAMNYLLVNAEKEVVDVEFAYAAEGEATPKVRSVGSVPVQRNHRTNLYGQLLTSNVDINVEILPDYDEDDDYGVEGDLVYERVYTAEEFAAAVANENVDMIKLGADIELSAPATRAAAPVPALTVSAGKSLVIDLSDFTLSYTSDVQNQAMIQNNGELTLKNGNVVFNYAGEPDSTYGKGNYAVVNAGTLTVDANISLYVEGYEGKKFPHALYAVQNSGTLVVNGGLISNDYNVAVRNWVGSETKSSDIIVNGGEIKGLRAIWNQLPSSSTTLAPYANITVKGGKLTATAIDGTQDGGYRLAIYSYNYGNKLDNVQINIEGGVIDGDIAVTGGTNKSQCEKVTVTGGQFSGVYGDVYSYAEDAIAASAITIKGGEFSSLSPMAYLNAADEVVALAQDITIESPADEYNYMKFAGIGTLDLNKKTITVTSSSTGKNYNFIDVNGKTANLTVKNGTINYSHVGANMAWNNSTNVFDVTAGGVLNIVDAEVNNNGGSDMGFVAHLNNWGEVTLNVENSVLTSNYVAVRVFNSGNDMNNVKIANSTLQGANYAFWVHNYTVADFGTVEKAEAHKALLNLDIFGNGNTFVAAKAPVRYGFTNSILVDENGVEFTSAGGTESEPQALEDVLASINTANPVIRVAEGGYVTWTTGASHGSTPLINAENNVTETVTICGSGENSYLVVDGSGVGSLRAANGAKLIFKNITIIDKSVSYAENAWEFTYLEFAGNLEFDNVTFKSGIKLQKEEDDLNAVFTDCTFITEENDVYAVWVSDGTSAFEGCKVQGTRGIKAHEAYGSEVTEIVIDGCEFGPLSKKPGVALGTLNAATRVVIQNSVFAGCQAGDQGNYIYETDTDVTTFEFVNSNNTVR